MGGGGDGPEAQRYDDHPVAAAAPAPENTRTTTPADTDAEKPREVRDPGAKADESEGKVAAPAVVATPPAREHAAADDQRVGRAASADEAQRLAKVRSEAPRKKAAVDLKPAAPGDALEGAKAKNGFADRRRQDRPPAQKEEAQGGQGLAQQPQAIANAPAAAPAPSGGTLGERDQNVVAGPRNQPRSRSRHRRP